MSITNHGQGKTSISSSSPVELEGSKTYLKGLRTCAPMSLKCTKRRLIMTQIMSLDLSLKPQVSCINIMTMMLISMVVNLNQSKFTIERTRRVLSALAGTLTPQTGPFIASNWTTKATLRCLCQSKTTPLVSTKRTKSRRKLIDRTPSLSKSTVFLSHKSSHSVLHI